MPSFTVGVGGGGADVYDRLLLEQQGEGKTIEEATAYLEALEGPQRPTLVLIRDAQRESALLTCIITAAIVVVYHAQVQAKVRLLDPAQPLFELSTCFHPNKDQRPSSLTRIMSKDRINAVRGAAADAMKTLYGLPSKVKKREYQLQQFSLSELVSDLLLTNKNLANKKGREAAECD
jgi:hypothetical protein